MENLVSALSADGRAAANDNHRGHINPVMDRARSGRLFESPADNLLAMRTLHRMDELLSRAESENAYPKWLEGKADHADYFGQDDSVECEGRSAEKIIEDYYNGPPAMHERAAASIPGKDVGDQARSHVRRLAEVLCLSRSHVEPPSFAKPAFVCELSRSAFNRLLRAGVQYSGSWLL